MMKKKNIFLLFISFVLVILLPSFLFFLSNLSFNSGSFITSGKINNFLEKYFKSDYLTFKKGDYYYKYGEYDKARIAYQSLDCKNHSYCYQVYHNLGNTFYRIGETKASDTEKLQLWQNAINNYSKSLALKETGDTKLNYDFVSKKIEELVKKMNDDRYKDLPADLLKRGEDLKLKVGKIFDSLGN